MINIEKYLDDLETAVSLMRYEKTHIYGARECFDYHHKKHNELMNEVFDCDLCRKKYENLSDEERAAKLKELKLLARAHRIKAHLFSRGCGMILC